ncbi:MAG: SDR family NAD(P)-dependent oxidoreductase [Hyphomicrobiaceae bacterium]
MELEGQITIITGAGQGIGKACAIRLAEAGADIVSADINGDKAMETAQAVEALGRRAKAITADLGDVGEIDRMIEETVAQFGRVDIIVNNAGVTRRADIMDLTEADWDRIHRVNSKGVFFCMQRAATEMINQKSGRIINIASIAGKGYIGTSNAIYAASKGAVLAMTKTAAQQLGHHNINVNSICPGITRTEIYKGIAETVAQNTGKSAEEVERDAVATVPIRRANEPEDVAELAVFLASPRSRNITGQSFNIDGGLIPD